MSVTIGIPACNEGLSIGNLLRQVLEQTRGLDRQIIVVSDGSADRTDEIVAGFPQAQLVRHCVQQGKAAAVNTVLRLARNDVVIMIDADVSLAPAAIPEILGAFQDPDTHAVGARIESIPGSSRLFASMGDAKWAAWDQCRLAQSREGGLVYLSGALFAVRRHLIDGVQLPPETVNDDAYFATLLNRRGHRFRYCPAAVCRIVSPQNLGDLIRQNLRTRIGRRQYSQFPEHLAAEAVWRKYMLRVARQPRLLLPALLYLALDAALRPIAAVAARTRLLRAYSRWTPASSTKRRPHDSRNAATGNS